jgi:hypothetical protein
MLPERLRDDLASHLSPPWITAPSLADDDDDDTCIHDSLLHRVPFFCGLDNYSQILICSKMKLQTFSPARRVLDVQASTNLAAEVASKPAGVPLIKPPPRATAGQQAGRPSLLSPAGQQGVATVDTRRYLLRAR